MIGSSFLLGHKVLESLVVWDDNSAHHPTPRSIMGCHHFVKESFQAGAARYVQWVISSDGGVAETVSLGEIED
jgi:hypothetical protein